MNDIAALLAKYAVTSKKSRVIEKWQELALEINSHFNTPIKQRSSVFRCCKVDPHFSRIAFEDTKELGGTRGLRYFFKVYSELRKKHDGHTN